MAKDRFHGNVRKALEKEGWDITADPYEIRVNDVDFEINLAAEILLAADRDKRRFIAAAVKRYQLRLMTYDPKQEVIVKWL